MSTIKVNKINNPRSNSKIYLNSTGRPSIDNLKPKIIQRNGSSSTESILTLSNFNEVHVYTARELGTELFIKTKMVTNGLYQMFVLCGSYPADTNIDTFLYPNGNSYSGSFSHLYRSTEASTANFIQRKNTSSDGPGGSPVVNSQFWFDHQFGGLGTTCYEQWTISSGPYNKYVQFEGMDTGPSLAVGYCRWNDTTTIWDWIGRLSWSPEAQFDYRKAWVRRIG